MNHSHDSENQSSSPARIRRRPGSPKKRILNSFDRQGAAFVLTLAVGIIGIAAAWGISRVRQSALADLNGSNGIEKTIVAEADGGTDESADADASASENAEDAYVEQQPQDETSQTRDEEAEAAAATYEETISGFRAPIQGNIVQAYSVDALVFNETMNEWRTHNGVDYSAAEGTAVTAVLDGTVLSVASDPLMGNVVKISHDSGLVSVYAGLADVADGIEAGREVAAGQGVGTVGNTAVFEEHLGTHLHFELLRDGAYIDPCP